MPFIAGSGRYRRETYPEPGRGNGSQGPTGPTGPAGSGSGSVDPSDIDPGLQGQMLITALVPPLTAIWSNDSSPRNNFTTGSWYGGVPESAGADGEAAGSLISVQTGSTTQRGLISAQHSSDTNGARFFGKKSRGTRSAPTAVQASDVLARVVASGYDGASYIPSAEISFEVEGAVAAGSVPQRIAFRTGTNAAPTTKLTIFSTAATYNLQAGVAMEFASVIAVRGTGLATAVSSTGDVRLRSQGTIFARNAADSADFRIIGSDASNNVDVGADSVVPQIALRATTTILGALGGLGQFLCNTTRFELTRPSEFSFGRSVVEPFITQQPSTVAGDAQRLWVRAQSVTAGGANGDGGLLLLTGGNPDGTGTLGGSALGLNPDDTFASVAPMVEVTEVATGRRVVALARTQFVNTADLPASSGDGIVYIGNAQTNPTANATNGHIYYSDAALPAWRFNGINLRLNGTSATANAGAGAAVPALVDRFLSIDIGGATLKIPCFAN